MLLQSGLALVLLATHGFEELLRSVGSILTLHLGPDRGSAARLRFTRRQVVARPSWPLVGAALVYLIGSGWMLYFTFDRSPHTLIWLAVVALCRRHRLPDRPPPQKSSLTVLVLVLVSFPPSPSSSFFLFIDRATSSETLST